MPPYSERVPEPYDNKPLTEELPRQQGGPPEGDTPSPRTPSTSSSISPPPVLIVAQPTSLVPILSEDGIPHDHTLPHYIRQITGEPTLDDIQNMTLRVLTETSSLQQMSLYTPNLRELNLEGSAISSLRDIGCELRLLEVLRINRCRLNNLNGTLGLPNLRELHAARNNITNAAPCAYLSHLRVLDLSRNQLHDVRSLGFLSACHRLNDLHLEGNPVQSNPNLRNYLQNTLHSLQILDHATLIPIGSTDGETPDDGVVFDRRQSLDSNNTGYKDNQLVSDSTDAYFPQAGPSTSSSVSKLTSGQILCGNMTGNRRKFVTAQREENRQVNILRWKKAFYKLRDKIREERRLE